MSNDAMNLETIKLPPRARFGAVFLDGSGSSLNVETVDGLWVVSRRPNGTVEAAPPAPGNLSASRPKRSRRTLAIARRQALETWEQWWASLPAGVRTLYDEVAAAADPDAAVLTRYEALQGTGAVAGVQVYSGGHVEVVRAE